MASVSSGDWDGDEEAFQKAFAGMDADELADYLDGLPDAVLQSLVQSTAAFAASVPKDPLEQAFELDPSSVSRPHLAYLAERIAAAYERMKQGHSVVLLVAMPPRAGKSEEVSTYTPIWLLRQDPSLKVALISYSPILATSWSRKVRNLIEKNSSLLGIAVAKDAGAVGDWQTTGGGEVHARSIAQGITGFGANVLIVDDPIKDSIVAHNEKYRDSIWERYSANLVTRREPPSLTIIVQTRWHEDDLSGRLQLPEWADGVDEVISFPAIAEENDVLGREPGDPLYPPLLPMVKETALAWWNSIRRSMSSYNWLAQYQQRPSSPQGSIFNVDWWRYWTTRPELVSYVENAEGQLVADGRVVMLPENVMSGRVIDSWDLNFDDTKNADYVVGQRWARYKANNYLVGQRRGRWDFPETLEQWTSWNSDGVVPEHVIEKKANGAALIAMVKSKFSGIKAVSPTTSKENRARAITSEVEHGNTYLPHPLEFYDPDEGTSWVTELQDELREFPSGKHDDMVDTLTQALFELRSKTTDEGSVSVPAAIAAAMARRKMERPDGTTEVVKPIRSPLTSTSIRRTPTGGRTRG